MIGTISDQLIIVSNFCVDYTYKERLSVTESLLIFKKSQIVP